MPSLTSNELPEGYDLETIRAEWIGRVVASSRGRYPVEYDPIRRYCHMTGDTNPLFLDPEVAAAGPHGGVVVPPPMVPYFAGKGPWPRQERSGDSPGFTYGVPTPGGRGINLSTVWEYPQPVLVGDRLHAQTQITDIFVKAIRLDPCAVWIVTETQIWNQRDELVARGTNTVLAHRAPAAAESAP